ncbi:nucleotide sugar dehydrogenase [Aciduliprofundum sp. MAR08-339]|uniref:nucleotide sugar dehydrogenase n=1 Tax=Aciduliprofundum sp. (strain MAR08-339) TaxID=673860 RepID=UPI0002A4B6B6|nr:nucleotide sugar dehydrogenase [Aciduliprofundum sp. MAR08-339]
MNMLNIDPEQVKRLFDSGALKIAIFGMGKMGLPLAAVFADRGAKVIGVDIDKNRVDMINAGENPVPEEPGLADLISKNVDAGRLRATTDGVQAAKDADVMIILVPTMIDDHGNVNLNPVYDVAEKIAKGLERGNIVITEATMPPGTTESLVPILEKSGLKLGEFGLAHAPERTMTGTAIRDITGQYPKIVGASDESTLNAVSAIYEVINKKGVIRMSSIKAAEAVKVFEGVYRDVNIALANELALFCEEQNLDALEVFKAANTQPYCHIHMPGAGVGGHCIPVYPWFVMNLSKRHTRLIRTARELNDEMPEHMVELTLKALNENGLSAKNANILVLGLTFRGDVYEFRKSPSIPYIERIKEWSENVYVYDPVCSEKDAERYGVKWKEDFRDVDIIVIMNDAKEFKELNLDDLAKSMRNKIIVDGRGIVDKERAKSLGFVYMGVGRK